MAPSAVSKIWRLAKVKYGQLRGWEGIASLPEIV